MKQKFLGLLEDLFIGAKVEGDTGISNLLNLKAQYFEKFQKELELDNLESAVYDRLYTFFRSYFNESGSLFFANTPKWEKRYTRISNNDVELFYKTKELYYVKSQKVYENLDIEIDGVKFYFDASLLGDRNGNEKKEVEFLFSDIQEDKFVFLVRYKTNQKYDLLKEITQLDTPAKARVEILNNLEKYRDRIVFEENSVYKNLDYFENNKGNIPDIFEMIVKEIDTKEGLFRKAEIILTLKDIKKITKLIDIDEKVLEKAFKIYNKQAHIDYFIHKDARNFLKEQFNLWIYDYLANDLDTIFNENSLKEIQNIKKIAYNLIDKIADFEDELKKVWLKHRFAIGSNYVITKDRLKNYGVLDKFLSHNGIDEQIQEWKELKLVDENFDISKIEKYEYLPFDTKFFKDIEIELLEKIENIDDELDGRLIKSENFQALNTLLNKYQNSIQTIYIDPPFNTGSDFDYIDKFQDSTWLTLMENRLQIARELLNQRGSFYLHLDHNADYLGRFLLNKIFGKENFLNEIVWYYSNKIPDTRKKQYTNATDNIFVYSKYKGKNIFNWQFDKRNSPIKVSKMKKINGKKMYLKDENGKGIYEERWERTADNLWKFSLLHAQDEIVGFQTQKPEKLLERILKSSSNKNNLILDFFSGSGTTIATAQKLNRKWIGIEMGEHFETIILPRMKKVLAGVIVGISKELEKSGELKKGGFFKYYKFEQFEDILQKAVYKENLEVSPKMSYATEIDFENEKLFYSFGKLYKNVDIAETISNLVGEKIVKVTKDKIILENREIELNDLTFENYPELKPLIYWS